MDPSRAKPARSGLQKSPPGIPEKSFQKKAMQASFFQTSTAHTRVKTLWAGLLRSCGLLALARNWARRKGVLVLTFHRVLGDAGLRSTASLPGMVVREETFNSFLKYA